MSFYSYAEKYPPILVRLLARHRNGPPYTTAEISKRAGISEYVVNSISQEVNWDMILFSHMRAFLAACDCDFTDFKAMDRKDAYMRVKFKAAKFEYLHDSPEWDYVLKPLVLRYREYLAGKIK
jgi:hypothetical protein